MDVGVSDCCRQCEFLLRWIFYMGGEARTVFRVLVDLIHIYLQLQKPPDANSRPVVCPTA